MPISRPDYTYHTYRYLCAPPIILDEPRLIAHQRRRHRFWNQLIYLDMGIRRGDTLLKDRDQAIRALRDASRLWWQDTNDLLTLYGAAKKNASPTLPSYRPVQSHRIQHYRWYHDVRSVLTTDILKVQPYKCFRFISEGINDNTGQLNRRYQLVGFRHQLSENAHDILELHLPVRWHRDLPSDKKITAIYVQRQRDKGAFYWYLNFVLRERPLRPSTVQDHGLYIEHEPRYEHPSQNRLIKLNQDVKRSNATIAMEREYYNLSVKISRARKHFLNIQAKKWVMDAKAKGLPIVISKRLSTTYRNALMSSSQRQQVVFYLRD